MQTEDKSAGYIVYHGARGERRFAERAKALRFAAEVGGDTVEQFIRSNLSAYEVPVDEESVS